MSQGLPAPGTYLARRTANMVVEQSDEGALLVWVPYALCAQGVEHIGKHMVVLFKKDGSLMENAKRNLMKAFGWDGVDLFALEGIPMPEGEQALAPEFELAECFHEEYTPQNGTPTTTFKAKWFNAIGGTQNMPEPMPDDEKKKVLAKFASKLKASGAGSSSKPAASAAAKPAASKPATPAAPAKSKGPPSRPNTAAAPRTSSLDEVWNWVCTTHEGKDDATLSSIFYEHQLALFPGRDYEANPLNPQEWGQVADKLGM